MKILIVSDRFAPERMGVVTFLESVIPYLRKNHSLSLLVPESASKDVFSEIPKTYVNLRKKMIGDIYIPKLQFRKVSEAMKDVDVVFINSLGPISFMAVLCALRKKKKLMGFLHVIEWELIHTALKLPRAIENCTVLLIKKMSKYLYNKCNLLIAPFISTRKIFENAGIVKPKIEVAKLGIDKNKFFPRDPNNELKKKLGISEDIKVIGYCGRLTREKNLDHIIDAVKDFENVKILFVGDGPLRKKFENDAIITGLVDNVEDYLSIMDVFVLPTRTETTCLAVMEAMCCGVPVVASNSGETNNYLIDNYNSLIFETGNVEQLSLQISKLFCDKDFKDLIKLNGLTSSKKFPDWDQTANSILAHLHLI